MNWKLLPVEVPQRLGDVGDGGVELLFRTVADQGGGSTVGERPHQHDHRGSDRGKRHREPGAETGTPEPADPAADLLP